MDGRKSFYVPPVGRRPTDRRSEQFVTVLTHLRVQPAAGVARCDLRTLATHSTLAHSRRPETPRGTRRKNARVSLLIVNKCAKVLSVNRFYTVFESTPYDARQDYS